MPTDKYGFFMDTGYIGVGDPYLKKGGKGDRDKGLNFKATKEKTGTGPDACFNKFVPQYIGEKYVKTPDEKKAALEEKKKKRASDFPFKPTSPMKEATGLGGYHGTLGGKVEHMKDYEIKEKQKGELNLPERNIMTSPQKKGSYGMHGTTIGHKVGPTGTVGEYSYVNHPYNAEHVAQLEHMKADKEARFTDKPFRPANPPKRGCAGVPGRTFNGKGPGVCGEYEYKELGPDPKVAREVLEKPFFPSKPPKEGYNCTLNKFPEYVPDPEEERVKAKKAEAEILKAKMDGKPAVFPVGVPKTSMTPSVLKMNIDSTLRGPSSPLKKR